MSFVTWLFYGLNYKLYPWTPTWAYCTGARLSPYSFPWHVFSPFLLFLVFFSCFSRFILFSIRRKSFLALLCLIVRNFKIMIFDWNLWLDGFLLVYLLSYGLCLFCVAFHYYKPVSFWALKSWNQMVFPFLCVHHSFMCILELAFVSSWNYTCVKIVGNDLRPSLLWQVT